MDKKRTRGLRKRWLQSGILLTAGVVVLITVLFSLGIRSYYYNALRTGLTAKAEAASGFFIGYISQTYGEYYQSAYRYTESFEDKDVVELQFVNTRGAVEVSSYGFSAGTYPNTPDVTTALTEKTIGSWTGRRTDTGERVMAVTAPLLASDGSVVGAMRYITSLRLVTKQVEKTSALAAGVGLVIILAVVLSNLYFIQTVTEPLVELTALARRIADGAYGIQAQKKYDDEIGDLTDAINEMSVKIGQTEKVQTEFISSVSHELRTPLTAITGWSETLAYDESISGDSRRGIAIISKESGRLTKMVEELLEFTRIQDGRFNLNVEALDVAGELADAIFTYGKLLAQEGMTVEYTQPDKDIPFVLGDSERLKQVFLNIMDNAAKYGRAAGRMEVTIGATDTWVVIRFRDFGPGIPPEELPFVKKKFYKGSGKERGSGIGLSVCDEIVTRHKGRLELENATDGRTGLVVTVMLPVMNEDDLTI
jgi:signal transduction histidine kinase